MPVSLSIGLAALGFGLYSFLSQWSYSEAEHEYLLIAYAIGAVLAFLALRMSRTGFGVFIIICLVGITFYANHKFDWRKSYVTAAEKGNYFAMEQYIDKYPTFEGHKFAWFLDTPRWVTFSKDCYEPLINARTIQKENIVRTCKNAALIKDFYGVDVRQIINDHYRKMQSAAKRLENGKLNKRKFEACLNNKTCAMIPLLPAGVEVDQQSEDYMDIRKQFWSVRNDKKMSQKNCDFFDFCRVMTAAEIIAFDKI